MLWKMICSMELVDGMMRLGPYLMVAMVVLPPNNRRVNQFLRSHCAVWRGIFVCGLFRLVQRIIHILLQWNGILLIIRRNAMEVLPREIFCPFLYFILSLFFFLFSLLRFGLFFSSLFSILIGPFLFHSHGLWCFLYLFLSLSLVFIHSFAFIS